MVKNHKELPTYHQLQNIPHHGFVGIVELSVFSVWTHSQVPRHVGWGCHCIPRGVQHRICLYTKREQRSSDFLTLRVTRLHSIMLPAIGQRIRKMIYRLRLRIMVYDLLVTLKVMLKVKDHHQWDEHEKKFMNSSQNCRASRWSFGNYGVQSGEISRVSQYVSKMIIAFDNMRIVHRYRTPITLRAYSKVFIYTFPIIYGPYFASYVS